LLSARSANPRARHSDNWKCEVLFPTAEWLVSRGGEKTVMSPGVGKLRLYGRHRCELCLLHAAGHGRLGEAAAIRRRYITETCRM